MRGTAYKCLFVRAHNNVDVFSQPPTRWHLALCPDDRLRARRSSHPSSCCWAVPNCHGVSNRYRVRSTSTRQSARIGCRALVCNSHKPGHGLDAMARQRDADIASLAADPSHHLVAGLCFPCSKAQSECALTTRSTGRASPCGLGLPSLRSAPVSAGVEAVEKLIWRNRPCALTKIDLSESPTIDDRDHGKGWRTSENTFIQPLK